MKKISKAQREELIAAILKDEHEYCFDKNYQTDEEWEETNGDETRVEAFARIAKWVTEATAEHLMEFYGDKYDYLFILKD